MMGVMLGKTTHTMIDDYRTSSDWEQLATAKAFEADAALEQTIKYARRNHKLHDALTKIAVMDCSCDKFHIPGDHRGDCPACVAASALFDMEEDS